MVQEKNKANEAKYLGRGHSRSSSFSFSAGLKFSEYNWGEKLSYLGNSDVSHM